MFSTQIIPIKEQTKKTCTDWSSALWKVSCFPFDTFIFCFVCQHRTMNAVPDSVNATGRWNYCDHALKQLTKPTHSLWNWCLEGGVYWYSTSFIQFNTYRLNYSQKLRLIKQNTVNKKTIIKNETVKCVIRTHETVTLQLYSVNAFHDCYSNNS